MENYLLREIMIRRKSKCTVNEYIKKKTLNLTNYNVDSKGLVGLRSRLRSVVFGSSSTIMFSLFIAISLLSVISLTESYSFKNYAVAKVRHASSTKLFEVCSCRSLKISIYSKALYLVY